MFMRDQPMSIYRRRRGYCIGPSGRIVGRPRIAGAIAGGILARIRGVAQRVRGRAGGGRIQMSTRSWSEAARPGHPRQAEREARQSGVATHAVLIASGWVSQADYAAALALALGVTPRPGT